MRPPAGHRCTARLRGATTVERPSPRRPADARSARRARRTIARAPSGRATTSPAVRQDAAVPPTPTQLREPVLAWFDVHARVLPWRAADRTPWGVLVSEVMLQQTPVVRVEPAWRAWMSRWPTPPDLAAASPRTCCGRGTGWATRVGRCGCRSARGRSRAARGHGALVGTRAARPAGRRGRTPRPPCSRSPTAGARSCWTPTSAACWPARSTASRCRHPARRSTRSAGPPASCPTTTRPRRAGRPRRWSSARSSAPPARRAATRARCGTCARGWPPGGPPTSTPRGAAPRGSRAPTGRSEDGYGPAARGARPVPAAAVDAVWPDARQLARCVDGLLADGLLTREPGASDDDPPTYRLPS